MTSLTTAHPEADDRTGAIVWLRVKIISGTAGLDPHDRDVLIVEVDSPDRAWRLDLLGTVIVSHPHVRPDRSTCTRVRAVIDRDVRRMLWLDETTAPVLPDVPLASRAAHRDAADHHDARGQIIEMDRARRAGRRWQ